MTCYPRGWDFWPMWRKRYWLFRKAEGYGRLRALWEALR